MNAGVFFSEISRCSPNRVIHVESLSGDKLGSSLSSLLRKESRQIWWHRYPGLEWHNAGQSFYSTRFRVQVVDEFLEEDIRRMYWASRSPELSPIKYVLEDLGRTISQCNPAPRNPQKLKSHAFGRMGFVARIIYWHFHKRYGTSL
ncbi:hypothetical protein TNCV_2873041 [Trichonephila clavipes]|nr:hypothetical protein TNCV_2873041 [Trichonephila clavipes]